MANQEHVGRLKQGIKTWNQWRQKNSAIEPDLSGADLSHVNLSCVNLSSANLSRASLIGSNLSGANFTRASLISTNFTKANLNSAILNGASLRESILNSASLSNVNLSDRNFSGANLSYANFSNTNLCRIQALGTSFSHATLTGVCLQDWNINSYTDFQNVTCEYIFTKYDDEKHQFTERIPHDPNQIFAPGEFTKRYQIVLETVDLFFNHGIDWKALLASLQELQTQYGDELSIRDIGRRAGGTFLVQLEIPSGASKAAIERQARASYEINLRALEAQYRSDLQLKDKEIAGYLRENANMMRTIELLASKPVTVEAKAKALADNQSKNTTYNQQGSKWGGGFAAEGGIQIGGTLNDFSQHIEQHKDEIALLITSLRRDVETFPQQKREEALVHLEDLEEDIQQPEKRKPNRIRTRLAALLAIAVGVGGAVATATDFTNNVLELSEKLGVPIEQVQPQQSDAVDVRAVEQE